MRRRCSRVSWRAALMRGRWRSLLLPARPFGRHRSAKSRSQFGEGLRRHLAAVAVGRWQGPIRSSFGAHFVFVDERTRGSLPPLDAVQDEVRRAWLNARRVEAEEKLYRTLRERYRVVVEKPAKVATSAATR